jgi:hypothetical protein
MIETKFGRNGVEISKSNYFFIDFLIETLVTCGVCTKWFFLVLIRKYKNNPDVVSITILINENHYC